MVFSTVTSVKKMDKVYFILHGGHQDGRVMKVDGDEITVGYVATNLGKRFSDGPIKSRRTIKLPIEKLFIIS
jgi:hypothetical protein